MTRTTTFTQSCARQSCLCAFAICWTAFGTTTSDKLSAHSAGFRKTAPKNNPFSRTAASPSLSIRLWGCCLWFKHPTPDVTNLVYCLSSVLKKSARGRWNVTHVSAFPCEQVDPELINMVSRTCSVIKKYDESLQSIHSSINI